jgi:3-hydroxymyristoyl/3-hydroxydecanoyl-(acyl carrier protein) dehydratase
MIYRFAIMQDKSIPGSLNEKRIAAYCKKVTIVWLVFIFFNGSMAAWTIFSGSDAFWAVYNGGVSYILMGILFAGEFIVRKKVQKNMPKEKSESLNTGFGSLERVRVIEKTENSVVLEFSIPGDSPYYNGHFTDFPILPAVAQVEMVLRFAAEQLKSGINVSEIRRIKFTNFIEPGVLYVLRLEKNDASLSFKIFSPDRKNTYSSGMMMLGEGANRGDSL